jgi:prepilin-type N-terminal cleavage/methylation domain-containing protein
MQKRGFSLVEVLVTISILVLIFSVSLPIPPKGILFLIIQDFLKKSKVVLEIADRKLCFGLFCHPFALLRTAPDRSEGSPTFSPNRFFN